VYRPKADIALELCDRARAAGIAFEWLTFDEWYGSKPQFLRALNHCGQKFVGEVHKHLVAWIEPPSVTHRPYRKGRRGRGRQTPRLRAGSRKPRFVEDLLKYDPALRDQPWRRWRVKDGDQGPLIWEVKHAMIHVKDEAGLPERPYHLLVARNVLHPEEVKYFISNAPPGTSVQKLLLVAFSRWRIERCFEDGKGEVGLDHYEGRRYVGLQRHLIISAISYLFLARMRHEQAEKKSRADRVPSAHGSGCDRSILVVERLRLHETVPTNGRRNPIFPSPRCGCSEKSHENDQAPAPEGRNQTNPSPAMQVGQDLAL
jgi:SRSO17 transposase